MNIDEILKLMNENLNIKYISKVLNVSIKDLEKFLIDNKYYYVNTPRAHSKTIVKLHDAAEYFITHEESYSKVERDFGLKKCYLKKYLEKYYPQIKIVKKHFNENIFDNIDTEEKAYWLGFIFADGNINSTEDKTSYRFEMTLSYKDLDHLQKFSKFVSFDKPLEERNITYKNKQYKAVRISLYSKHLWEVLNSYGCTPRKSLTLEFPNINIFSNKCLIRHFIRGYFDGDGTLGIYTTTAFQAKCLLGMLGTESMLNGIRDFFIVSKNIKKDGSEKYPSKAHRIVYATREAFYVSFCLYYNSNIYLERKFNIFNEYCRLYKELYKELSSKIGKDCDVDPEVILKIAKGFKIP